MYGFAAAHTDESLNDVQKKPEFFTSYLPKFKWSGYLKNETAYRFIEPRTYTKIRNILFVSNQIKLQQKHTAFFSVRAYHDLVYDLFDYGTVSARSERDAVQPLAFVETLPQERDSDVLEIRELYVTASSENSDFRAGKQFIVWGVIPGIRVVDEVNPVDFRELILPELLDYRVPLWSVKWNFYHKFGEFELIWIPDIQFHIPAPRGSEWELLQKVPGTIFPKSFAMRNMESGFRYAFNLFDTSISLSYFNTWDDFPVIFRDIRNTDDLPNDGATDQTAFQEFLPEFKRIEIYGLTMVKQIFDSIVNIEAAYVKNKYFGLRFVDRNKDGFLDYRGAIRRHHLRYGMSIDFNYKKTEISPGFTLQYIFNYDPFFIQDRLDKTFNLYIRKKIRESNITLDFLAIYLLNLKEVYLKPRLVLKPVENVALSIGLDWFKGNASRNGPITVDGQPTDLIFVAQSTHFIGNFDGNDRIFMEIKYSF